MEDLLHTRWLSHRSFLYLEGYLLNRLSDNSVVISEAFSSLNHPYPWAEEAVGARVEERISDECTDEAARNGRKPDAPEPVGAVMLSYCHLCQPPFVSFSRIHKTSLTLQSSDP